MPALQPRVRRARVRTPRGMVRRQGQDPARRARAAAAAHRRRQAAAQRANAVQGTASARQKVSVLLSNHTSRYGRGRTHPRLHTRP